MVEAEDLAQRRQAVGEVASAAEGRAGGDDAPVQLADPVQVMAELAGRAGQRPAQEVERVALAVAEGVVEGGRARAVDQRGDGGGISGDGGVPFEALTEGLMLKDLPGVFCAGEMLDWEAPTGGYLLTACFASGRRAGIGMLDWLGIDAPA
ncbi:NAD(P)/FAD-dependent oxidoreductase [Metapseudomonas otitidis]|uniref:NAD(P)/FAD-dependent oxidoreductase n=1 Tax=Metapseudomonas otitidis TaxID=319939 RepID=UPI00374D0C2F